MEKGLEQVQSRQVVVLQNLDELTWKWFNKINKVTSSRKL